MTGPGRRVLIVDAEVPDPLFGFGFPRMFEIVQSLVRAGHSVSMYPMLSRPHDLQRMDRLCDRRVRFFAGEGARGLRRLLWSEGASFDVILISRAGPMQAFNDARWSPKGKRPTVVYDLEAVTTPRDAMRRRLFGPPWTAGEEASALAAEVKTARGADAVIAVTEADQALIGTLLPAPSFVLSHPIQLTPSRADFAERSDLLFVGRMTGSATEFPNVDAVRWFVRDAMPRLDRLIGEGYRLHMVGLYDGDAGELAAERVILHGAVESLAPFYERCRVFVAPTRYAAGVPIKVVEAMGMGLPCVATPLLARQVGAEGHGFASDPSPDAFAERCARLYLDADAWRAAREHGLALARRRFSQEAFEATLTDLMASATGGADQHPAIAADAADARLASTLSGSD